jgi:hypothetical protein
MNDKKKKKKPKTTEESFDDLIKLIKKYPYIFTFILGFIMGVLF